MSARRFRTPVVLETPVVTSVPGESPVMVFLTVGDDFADIRLLRQREETMEGRLSATATHSIRLRLREDIAPGWRLRAGLKTFRLLSVAEETTRPPVTLCLAELEEGYT